MPYTTHLQQVLSYLKQGGKIQPVANVAAGIPTVKPIGGNPQLDLGAQAAKLAAVNPAAKKPGV